jgi:hypothetical protein
LACSPQGKGFEADSLLEFRAKEPAEDERLGLRGLFML